MNKGSNIINIIIEYILKAILKLLYKSYTRPIKNGPNTPPICIIEKNMPAAIPKLLKDIFLLSDIWFKIITMSVPVDNLRNKSPIIIIDKLED